MTFRADSPSTHGVVVPLRAAPQRRLAQGYIVPIADAVAAIMFDEPTAATDDRPRLSARVDGKPLGRPLISTSLPLRAGGRRHLLLTGRGAASLTGCMVELALGPELAAAIDPDWLQPPLTDGSALIDGLSDVGRRRLLKLFLTTGASLFGFGGASEFNRAAHRLLEVLGVRAVEPASWCPVGAAGHVLTYRMPGAVDVARIGALVALAPDEVTRLPGARLAVEPLEGGSLLHVHVPRALPAGRALIGLGAAPVHLRAPDAGDAPQPLVPWLARRDPATQAWVQALVEAAADADPVAAALTHEICHAAAAPPALAVRHLSATPAGVLYALSLRDPHGLIRAVRIERGGAVLEVEPAGTGFAALARQSRFDDRCRLRLVYHSGRALTVHDGPLAGYRGEIPEGFAAARRAEAASAIARARLSRERPARTPAVESFGAPPGGPNLGVVVAVGDDLDLVRARAAMLFAEPGARGVELVYHAAEGQAAAGARAAMADAEAVFGIAHRLVTLPPDADAAERLLAAFAVARAPALLVLGADVLPATRGWLAPWLCRLGPARPILGGTLLDHAGGVVGSGLPETDLPTGPTAPGGWPSAECVGLTRAAAEAIRDAGIAYPNPDVMLAAAVGDREVATLLRCRFVRYAEAPVDPFGEAVDDQARELVLKPSFSPSGDEVRS